MTSYNAANERTKRRYFDYLKEAKGHSEATVDAAAKALSRFEVDTKFRDFKTFRRAQAKGFKHHLGQQKGHVGGEKLSKSTLYQTLTHLKRFFHWLSLELDYKSRLRPSDADFFNPTGKDARVATARRERPSPTLEQVKHVILRMPTGTEIERRNQALIAFAVLTGARDSAVASFKLKHVDLAAESVCQDAREVKTKNSKTFTTFFFPVGEEILEIVADWVTYLQKDKLWGNDDPLFPATHVSLDVDRHFVASGLKREHWSNASPIRDIFRHAFKAADLPYFNPHSLRNTLVRFGQSVCQTAEEYKAWSQNLGHEGVLTTFRSYGEVESRRQGEIIRQLRGDHRSYESDYLRLAKALARELRDPKLGGSLFAGAVARGVDSR
jgi:integrase